MDEEVKKQIIDKISDLEKEEANLHEELWCLNEIVSYSRKQGGDYSPLTMDELRKLEQELFENPTIRWWLTVKAYGFGKEFFE